MGASVRARLLDRARAQQSDFQVLLTRYTLERLLYRLSISEHRDRFILKGAMLFSIWVDTPFRPTRDLDLLGYGNSDLESIAAAFRAICAHPVADDGVQFDVAGLEAAPIREELKYGGVRVRTTAVIDRARIPVQIDIGFGDAITPAPIQIDYPVLLDAPAPRLRAYPVETVVAEKFEALVTRGIANSRLKDFYDLWLIACTLTLDESSLAEAVRRTFERRGTPIPSTPPVGLTNAFATAWGTQWRTFLGRERMAAVPDDLAAVVADLRKFLMAIVQKVPVG
jgi:predicted nucleotidyltransferase component of viral defense system